MLTLYAGINYQKYRSTKKFANHSKLSVRSLKLSGNGLTSYKPRRARVNLTIHVIRMRMFCYRSSSN